MGLIRQRLVGSGTVFLSSSGTMVEKELKAGETILVDTFCLLAYAGTCKMDLKRAGGISADNDAQLRVFTLRGR